MGLGLVLVLLLGLLIGFEKFVALAGFYFLAVDIVVLEDTFELDSHVWLVPLFNEINQDVDIHFDISVLLETFAGHSEVDLGAVADKHLEDEDEHRDADDHVEESDIVAVAGINEGGDEGADSDPEDGCIAGEVEVEDVFVVERGCSVPLDEHEDVEDAEDGDEFASK